MRTFPPPEVPVGESFDSPTYYSIVGTSMQGVHAIATTAEYDFFAVACDRAGALPRQGGTGTAGHSMALQHLAEAPPDSDADLMDVGSEVDLAKGRLVLMPDSVPEQETLAQVTDEEELDGFEDAHTGDAAQATADAARDAHQVLVASIVQDTETRLRAQYDAQLSKLLAAATANLPVRHPHAQQRQRSEI
jgi:hypothetical protein